MKMVLQFQSVNLGSSGKYNGEATYLTDLLFEQTSYQTADMSIRESVAQTGAKVKGVSMTIDGNSGQWGCIIKYSEAAAPLPLTFGVDIDSQEAIYDYYIEYVKAELDKLVEKQTIEEYLDVIDIIEDDENLVAEVNRGYSTELVKIPYPIN